MGRSRKPNFTYSVVTCVRVRRKVEKGLCQAPATHHTLPPFHAHNVQLAILPFFQVWSRCSRRICVQIQSPRRRHAHGFRERLTFLHRRPRILPRSIHIPPCSPQSHIPRPERSLATEAPLQPYHLGFPDQLDKARKVACPRRRQCVVYSQCRIALPQPNSQRQPQRCQRGHQHARPHPQWQRRFSVCLLYSLSYMTFINARCVLAFVPRSR